MESKFNPPVTQEEFEKRAKESSLTGSLAVLNGLKHRLASQTAPLRAEIKYLEAVIEFHKNGSYEWVPEAKASK